MTTNLFNLGGFFKFNDSASLTSGNYIETLNGSFVIVSTPNQYQDYWIVRQVTNEEGTRFVDGSGPRFVVSASTGNVKMIS